jgi:hypothetical protein
LILNGLGQVKKEMVIECHLHDVAVAVGNAGRGMGGLRAKQKQRSTSSKIRTSVVLFKPDCGVIADSDVKAGA